MRLLIFGILLFLMSPLMAGAGPVPFSESVKASLIFREEPNPSKYGYPHVLQVFLCLQNASNSDVFWVADSVGDVEAELLDSTGKPVQGGPQAASILSNSWSYLLPHGSRLEWLISHGGISMMNKRGDEYALMVGGNGWLIPIKSVGEYSLRIRLHGLPRERNTDRTDRVPGIARPLLFDLPPAKLAITK